MPSLTDFNARTEINRIFTEHTRTWCLKHLTNFAKHYCNTKNCTLSTTKPNMSNHVQTMSGYFKVGKMYLVHLLVRFCPAHIRSDIGGISLYTSSKATHSSIVTHYRLNVYTYIQLYNDCTFGIVYYGASRSVPDRHGNKLLCYPI